LASPQHAAAEELANELVTGCVEIIGERLVAAVLHGSLATASYVPGRSDVDVLVVVEAPPSDDELLALRDLVVRLARRAGNGGLDLHVLTRAAAASLTEAPTVELYVGVHGDLPPEVLLRVDDPTSIPELATARAGGYSLIGPEPRLLLSPIPDEWVVARGDAYVARWQELTDDEPMSEFMVLTTCRIWRFAVEGVHCSKAEAGRWALERDPSLTAVRDALRRRGGEDVTIPPADIGALLARVRGEIADRNAGTTTA
jgi:predicted nucleotidyltransferase